MMMIAGHGPLSDELRTAFVECSVVIDANDAHQKVLRGGERSWSVVTLMEELVVMLDGQ